ncbi:MAG: hypothetical protein AAGF29_06610 [Pseudomonadota bacterium]
MDDVDQLLESEKVVVILADTGSDQNNVEGRFIKRLLSLGNAGIAVADQRDCRLLVAALKV